MSTHTVDEHFVRSSPKVRSIYDAILVAARELGPVQEDPKKTSIHLNRRSAFAGIQTRRDLLVLTVKSSTDISSDRVTKREQVSARRWHLEIKLHDAEDVDAEIRDWLARAYQLAE